jgi:alkylation response protein AidB-like acyl-CoA dehydrogenase
MPGFLFDTRDARFVLFDQLQIQGLSGHARYAEWNRKTLEMLLEEARKLSENRLLPLNMEGDRTGAKFENGEVYSVPGTKETFADFTADGWLNPCEDQALGGQQLPHSVKSAIYQMFFGANFPFMCYSTVTHDAAKLIELYGTQQQRQQYMEKMYAGEWTGTMALTEPEAGSDVGSIITRAVPNPDGTYSISGQKIYTTNGDHDVAENIVHLVLARIEGDPPGTKGLSLFVVPKFRLDPDGKKGAFNDVRCVGIEDKMGLKSSPTTTLAFGDKGGCIGYLLGKERQGIEIMFHMMNASRLGVGEWGAGLSTLAYMHALRYARQRKQGRGIEAHNRKESVPIIQHPDIRRTLAAMKSHTEGMRAMLCYCGYAMDQALVSGSSEEKAKWQQIIDLLTPICKAYCTEKAVEFSSMAIQVYGGAGYTKDYPVEQFLRDSKISCILEGTNGIQAIDFILRKIRLKKGEVFFNFIREMDPIVEQARAIEELAPYAAQLEKVKTDLYAMPDYLAEKTGEDGIFFPLLKAKEFLEAAGEVFMSWFLLWGAVSAFEKLDAFCRKKNISRTEKGAFIEKNAEAAFLQGKIQSAKFYAGNVLPVTAGKIEAIRWGDVSAWEMTDRSLG